MPVSSIPAPPPPSIGVIVKKDERGPLGDVYQQDGDWMKDIEINNLRNRYLLTKPGTQQQVISDLLFVSPTPSKFTLLTFRLNVILAPVPNSP